MGFLDSEGLARLWGKVTGRRRVLTAAEYAALSEEEKNADVVYMVPEEGGGSGGGGIPSGFIGIWSGAADAVPDGWHICDGTEGTPDLRGRFVLGVSDSHTAGETGGSETVTLTVEQMPTHIHTVNFAYGLGYSSGNMTNPYVIGGSIAGHSSEKTTETGNSNPHNNMPPYYALCYIMKL